MQSACLGSLNMLLFEDRLLLQQDLEPLRPVPAAPLATCAGFSMYPSFHLLLNISQVMAFETNVCNRIGGKWKERLQTSLAPSMYDIRAMQLYQGGSRVHLLEVEALFVHSLQTPHKHKQQLSLS